MNIVKDLTRLRRLSLDDTAITDNGLNALTNSKNLQDLSVKRTKVTAAGIAKLRIAVPNLELE